MKRAFATLIVLCTIAFLALGRPAGQELKVNIPPSTSFTLDNGLRIVLMEYHRLPLIEMQLTVGGGRSIEPDTLAGLAGMTVNLMKLGTTTRTATQIADQVDFIGASLDVNTALDQFMVNAEFLVKDLSTGLELFSDIILHPTFAQEEIERERSQRVASLSQILEDPRSIAGVYFSKRLYGTHPYGKPGVGTKDGLARITRDAVTSFYRAAFIPNNAILVVVGDFKSEEMLAKLKSVFGGWMKGAMPAIPIAGPGFLRGRHVVLVNKPDVTQTQIRIGNTSIDVKNPDRPAIDIANTVLGAGFTSRLVDEIRVKRSLTYNVGSRFSPYRLGGSYSISTFTKHATVRTTIDVALNEVKKIRESGITAWELGKAKNYLTGDFARGLQAPDNLTAQISGVVFYGLPESYLQAYVPRLRAVTLDDVKKAVNKYFHHDDLLIMTVTNAAETKAQMEGLGTIEEVPVEKAIE
jgi:zinc protease